MEFTFAESREAFEAAAAWFLSTSATVGDRWDEPGLGEWDVRSLVGHTSRSFVTVEAYLATPSEVVDVETTALYYTATRSIAQGPAVAQRGRDAGTALGDDPAAAVAALAERVTALVRTCSGDELLTTIAGGMRLRDYLPTRTFELVVHTCDLAVALGLAVTPPADASREAMRLVTELLVTDGVAGDVLLALTGRTALAANFSVL